MSGLTRRRFLTRSSVGAVTVAGGMLTAGALLESEQPVALPDGQQLVAHVRSVQTGEIALLGGTRELVIRDQALARRLVRAAAGRA
jgi:hypothetical protein